MDIVQMAREMGKELQKSTEYVELQQAMDANDNDVQLQELIGAFNMHRMNLNNEMQKTDADENKINELNAKVQEIYGAVMATPAMMTYQEKRQALDNLMNRVNTVLTHALNGEDPDTCPDHEDCTGSCSTCGGCH